MDRLWSPWRLAYVTGAAAPSPTPAFTTGAVTPTSSATTAKAMKKGIIAELSGKLRHDRWKDKGTGRWTGKVFVAVDPGEGTVRSKGIASAQGTLEAA